MNFLSELSSAKSLTWHAAPSIKYAPLNLIDLTFAKAQTMISKSGFKFAGMGLSLKGAGSHIHQDLDHLFGVLEVISYKSFCDDVPAAAQKGHFQLLDFSPTVPIGISMLKSSKINDY